MNATQKYFKCLAKGLEKKELKELKERIKKVREHSEKKALEIMFKKRLKNFPLALVMHHFGSLDLMRKIGEIEDKILLFSELSSGTLMFVARKKGDLIIATNEFISGDEIKDKLLMFLHAHTEEK
jgi:hypothetical protein